MRRESKPESFPFSSLLLWLAFLAIVILGLTAPPRRAGDGPEYYAMTHAFLAGRPPALTQKELDDFKRWMDAQPREVGFAGAVVEDGRLRAGDRQDFPHFWFYSLLAAPFVGVARALAVHDNFGFLGLNAFLLGLASWRVQRSFPSEVGLLVLASPIVWFVNKAHTEVFTFSLLCIAVSEARRGRYQWAALAAAVASTQNPPILAAVACFWAVGVWRWYLTHAKPARQRERGVPAQVSRGSIACIALTIVAAALHPVYYLLRLGVYTPQRLNGGYSPQIPSLQRYLAFVLDPDIGFVPWLPLLSVLAVIGLIHLCLDGGRADVKNALDLRRSAACAIVSGAFFLFAFTQTGNVNHGGTIHISRYAIWLLPLTLPLLEPVAVWLLPRLPAALPTVGLGAFAVYASYFGPSTPDLYLVPSPIARRLYEQAPCLYRPLPEIFYERHWHIDGAFAADPGTAATPDCSLIHLSRSWPFATCGLTPTERSEATALFDQGWQSVWVVRPGKLGICNGGVYPAVAADRSPRGSGGQATGAPSPADMAWNSWLERGIQRCEDPSCRASGLVEHIRPVASGLEVVGWVALPDGSGQPAALFVVIGGEPVAEARLKMPRPDVAQATQRPDLADAGFSVVIPVQVMARFVDGAPVCPDAVRVINADGTAYDDLAVTEEVCEVLVREAVYGPGDN